MKSCSFHLCRMFGPGLNFWLLLTSCLSLPASEILFRTISPHEGLPNARVYAIAQDPEGFIWLGSEAGLHRFDGYRFINFSHDPSNPKSLSNGNVSGIQVDRDGFLWLSTWGGGLNRFDRATSSFETLPIAGADEPSNGHSLSDSRIQSMMLDREGQLLVGTFEGGLNKIDPKTRAVKVYRHDATNSRSLAHNRVWAISQDSSGRVWLGTDAGLCYLESEDHFVKIPFQTGLASKEFDYRVRAITHCRNGDTWLGSEVGLYVLNHKTGKIEAPNYEAVQPVLGSITQIYEDELNRLWVGTTTNGLYVVERGSGEKQILMVKQYQQESGRRGTLGFNDVRQIYRDRNGLLWLGTRGGGVSIYNPLLDAITHVRQRDFAPYNEQISNVTAVLEDSSERYWIGTLRGGLALWDRSSGLSRGFRATPGSADGLSHNMVFSLAKERSGVVWVGTYRGLNRYDPQRKEFKHYFNDPENADSLSSNQIRNVFCDSRGQVWVGTYRSGVCRLDPVLDKWKRYISDDKPGSLGGNDITSIFEDDKGAIWVGTEGGGISRHHFSSDTFTTYWGQNHSLHGTRIISIYQSPGQALWLATSLGEIFYFDTAKNEWLPQQRFDGKGLLDVNVDHNGHFWFQTYSQLRCFHPKFNQEINLDLGGWFPNFLGIERTTIINSRGEYMVAGSDGFLIIDPKLISLRNLDEVRLVLTGFNGLGTVKTPSYDRKANRLSMDHDQSSFQVEFALLDFANSAANRFQYQLDDSTDDWIDLDTQNNLSFTRLAPGLYNLRIRATNNLGIQNPDTLTLDLLVRPPFWQTWWFRIAAAIALIAGIWLGYRQRVRRLHQHNEELERRVAERTHELEERNKEIMKQQKHIILQEKMASLGLLTAGIAHEIKNPLNFINNFSEVSMELAKDLGDELGDHSETLAPAAYEDLRDTVEDLIENASLVRKHGQRANQIIAGMMDLTAGSGKPTPTSLNKLVSDMTVLATGGLNSDNRIPGLAIRQQLSPNVGEISMVGREIGRALVALVKNGLDALSERQARNEPGFEPTLLVSTDDLGENVEVSVWDNGVGIASEMLEKVFTPFFTTKPTGSGHIGLGLSLAYEVIQGHRGQLAIESDGSSFTLVRMVLPKQ